jgi:hypothetical protein
VFSVGKLTVQDRAVPDRVVSAVKLSGVVQPATTPPGGFQPQRS